MKKYEKIFKDLETQILAGKLGPGDYLPTEFDLAQHYAASRDTVRKALKLLTEEGLIEKMQGRGTQVTQRQRVNFPVSELTSYQELVQTLGMHSVTKLISMDKVIIDDQLSHLTGFAKNAITWRITRQRVVDGTAAVVDTDYLLKSLVPDMSREIAEQSIYAYLETKLGLSIAYAQKDITIDHVTDSDKRLLDLGKEQHVVSVKSQVFLADGRQFQFTESRHKLEKFRFVDLAKRKRG